MVHQHFMLVPVFTVAENVMLGAESRPGAAPRTCRHPPKVARRRPSGTGLDVDPTRWSRTCRSACSSGWRSSRRCTATPTVLILDEPTAVLTPQETDELLDIMRAAQGAGTSIVFITHKLREVKAVADLITVIRRGKVVGTADPGRLTTELAAMMVGRAVSLTSTRPPPSRRRRSSRSTTSP